MTYSAAYQKLEKYGQTHVLKYFDTLEENKQQLLLESIEKTDISFLEKECLSDKERKNITPLAAMQLDEIAARKGEFLDAGLDAIRKGKVGAVLLAGGMGTRLGSDKPKGMYNVGITRELYIFECIINNILDVVKQAGVPIPLYIMTSNVNDADTRAFFKEKNYFGYDPSYISFFVQKMAPATDREGKIYMESPYEMALSPNGNGGWFASMSDGGLLPELEERGIEWLNVFAVDNVLQRIADPVFVGATLISGVEAGAKVIRKNDPYERVGVLCLEDGHPSIVEYYELSEEMAHAKNEKGERLYNFGVTLNYLFKKDSLIALLERELPLHRVEKKIPYMDESGNKIKPEAPNGYKYENLVLDMINMLDSCLPFEIVRNYEFAPIKNKEGVDSVESARALLTENGVVL